MSEKYIYIYNNFINFTRNKDLYISLNRKDHFSDRLTLFLLHFAFFLKVFKDKESKVVLQEVYDYVFRQLELSIREIGYGDQSINKKMKDYINLFYAMLDKIHYWDSFTLKDKESVLFTFLGEEAKKGNFVDYIDKYRQDLSNNTFNFYLKGVIKT